MVSDGKFREDLFFRLSVVPITMPPLRARKEDIPMLVQAFLKGFAEENKKPVTQIADPAMQALLRHDWPGNVRELRTAIEHGVVMATGPQLTFRDLPLAVRQGASIPLTSTSYGVPRVDAQPALKENPLDLHLHEHQLILKALDGTGGNVTQAAKHLGISRRTLHRKLKNIKETHSPLPAGDSPPNP
jgi:DNA-binding NtrC family response regulator